MAPRENYFFFILAEVKSLFDSYGPSDKIDAYDEMWFEFNNTPLKWNVPIGVQFDTLIGLANKQKDLPWCLTFHYRGFPEEQVLRLEGINFLRFHFINSLKESHCLRLGSAQELLSMQKKDEQRMIEGLKRHNFDSFWEINSPLCDREVTELKKYAVRFYNNRHHTYVQPSIEVNRAPVAQQVQPPSEESKDGESQSNPAAEA
jgi:autophagy-related protein 5